MNKTIIQLIEQQDNSRNRLVKLLVSLPGTPMNKIYSKINELDNENEIFYKLSNTSYLLPENSEELVLIEDAPERFSVADMKANITLYDKFMQETHQFLKTVAGGSYLAYLEALPELKERIDKTVEYLSMKKQFEDLIIEDEGVMQLPAPEVFVAHENEKTIRWAQVHKVPLNNHKAVYLIDEDGAEKEFIATPEFSYGNYIDLDVSELSEPAMYTIKVKAISDSEERVDSEYGSLEFEIRPDPVQLVINNLEINKAEKTMSYDAVEEATGYEALAVEKQPKTRGGGIPEAPNSQPLVPEVVEGKVVFDLSELAIGEWEIRTMILGDDDLFLDSDIKDIDYSNTADVNLFLDDSTIVKSGDRDSFSFDLPKETDEFELKEVSGIDETHYTLEVVGEKGIFTVLTTRGKGKPMTPKIQAKFTGEHGFVDSNIMEGVEVGIVEVYPQPSNVSQDGRKIKLKLPVIDEKLKSQGILVGVMDSNTTFTPTDFTEEGEVSIDAYDFVKSEAGEQETLEINLVNLAPSGNLWVEPSEATQFVYSITDAEQE